eukprot:Skav234273  [mRNA]  locus=scaffold1464:1087105:1088190:+ [translate_table: standard]
MGNSSRTGEDNLTAPLQTLYLLMNNSKKSVKTSEFMSEVYAAHKAKDGYLNLDLAARSLISPKPTLFQPGLGLASYAGRRSDELHEIVTDDN